MADVPLQAAAGRKPDAIQTRTNGFLPGRLLWPLAVVAIVFFASSRSHVASPGITNVDDKFAHFGVYGLLATLVCRLGGGWRAPMWALIVASAFGVSDEWHQSFVPGRSCDVADWVADTVGAVAAVALYCGWAWYRRVLETPLWPRPQRLEKS